MRALTNKLSEIISSYWIRPCLRGSGQIFQRTIFLPVQPFYTEPYKYSVTDCSTVCRSKTVQKFVRSHVNWVYGSYESRIQ